MKKIILIALVSASLLSFSQNSQSLIKIHNVNNITDMNAISNPSAGHLVYVIANSTMYQYNGTSWIAVGGGGTAGWGLLGNSGTNSNNNLLGTSDNQDLSIGANNEAKITIKASDQRLLFPKVVFNPNSGIFNSGVIGIDQTTNGRLRITAGDQDNYSNTLGASIDLHGNTVASPYAGRLDLVAGSGASNTNQGINFYTSNNLRATMLGNGHLGINTVAPTELFHIHGTGPNFRYVDGNEGLGRVLTSDANGVASWQIPSGGGGSAGWGLLGNSGTNPFINFIGTTNLASLTFRTNNVTRMVLEENKTSLLFNNNTNNEAVLIGLMNVGPLSRLRIAGSNAISNPTTSFNAGAIDLFSTDISTSLSCDVHIMAGDPFGDNNDGSIEFFTRGINRMRIDEAGLFIVNGDASKPGGGDWSNISDKRLKKNVKPYNKGLKEILQINPVSYQYNKMSKSYDLEKTYIGIIAQEIEKVLPSTVVIMNDSLNTGLTDKRIFNSSELLYTAINAIKEQQEIIELLLQKNEFLEHRIKKIELKK